MTNKVTNAPRSVRMAMTTARIRKSANAMDSSSIRCLVVVSSSYAKHSVRKACSTVMVAARRAKILAKRAKVPPNARAVAKERYSRHQQRLVSSRLALVQPDVQLVMETSALLAVMEADCRMTGAYSRFARIARSTEDKAARTVIVSSLNVVSALPKNANSVKKGPASSLGYVFD